MELGDVTETVEVVAASEMLATQQGDPDSHPSTRSTTRTFRW